MVRAFRPPLRRGLILRGPGEIAPSHVAVARLVSNDLDGRGQPRGTDAVVRDPVGW